MMMDLILIMVVETLLFLLFCTMMDNNLRGGVDPFKWCGSMSAKCV
jgi:hypothetical protein